MEKKLLTFYARRQTSVFTSEEKTGRDNASFVACAVRSSGVISLWASRCPPLPSWYLRSLISARGLDVVYFFTSE